MNWRTPTQAHSRLVEFESGEQHVVSGNALRKLALTGKDK